MKIIVAILLLSLFCGCNSATIVTPKTTAIDLVAVKKIILKKNELYRRAYLKGDSAAFADLHHSETVNMPPDGPLLIGKGKIGATVKDIPKVGVKDMVIKVTNVSGGPDEVIEEGTFGIVTASKIHNGKYIVIWKRESETWKIYRAIWNMDTAWL
jgi:ketosteroid isomerase-like protein